jgi:hypothetical protein
MFSVLATTFEQGQCSANVLYELASPSCFHRCLSSTSEAPPHANNLCFSQLFKTLMSISTVRAGIGVLAAYPRDEQIVLSRLSC